MRSSVLEALADPKHPAGPSLEYGARYSLGRYLPHTRELRAVAHSVGQREPRRHLGVDRQVRRPRRLPPRARGDPARAGGFRGHVRLPERPRLTCSKGLPQGNLLPAFVANGRSTSEGRCDEGMAMNFGSIIAAAALVMAAACASADETKADQAGPAPALPAPDVVMAAAPPPPFTYWAPDGSTIRNHPRQAGIWIAQAAGRPDRYYFGDQCQASRYQKFVGRPLAEMPAAPPGALWRTHCSTCAVTQDLAPNRLNISFDEKTGAIDAIACG